MFIYYSIIKAFKEKLLHRNNLFKHIVYEQGKFINIVTYIFYERQNEMFKFAIVLFWLDVVDSNSNIIKFGYLIIIRDIFIKTSQFINIKVHKHFRWSITVLCTKLM